METAIKINEFIGKIVWGTPTVLLLLGFGAYMSCRTGFFQIRHFGYVMKMTVGGIASGKSRKKGENGALSPFQTLCTALSATVGTGNIAGVAYAIAMGGPGAVFWMWAAALLGMMTAFSENVLGIYFRKRDGSGSFRGGAMYYLENGLGSIGRRRAGRALALLFSASSVLASLGIGNMSQVLSIKESVLSAMGTEAHGIVPVVIGAALTAAVGITLVGGIGRIAKANELLMPFMALLYAIGSLTVIFMNFQNVLPAFCAIFKGAFSFKSACGGVGGYAFLRTASWGVKRGVFSNEAGLGSSVTVHCESDIEEPVEQGMWSIFEVFFDTMVVCTLTALAVLTSGAVYDASTVNKTALAALAFSKSFGRAGGVFVSAAVLLFAFSSMLGWSHYGLRGAEYVFGEKAGKCYKILFILLTFAGAVMDADIAIAFSDTFNGLMILPNLIGISALSGTVLNVTKNYAERKFNGRALRPALSFYSDIQAENEEKCRKSSSVKR